jgi:tetratricopeptide (TPR) repeat protein
MPYVRRLAELVLAEDIDNQAYIASKERKLIYRALEGVYSFGMSRFIWQGRPTAENEEDLAAAFSYFNQHVHLESLKNNFDKAKENIDNGIHPIADRAFTKMGSFMASILKEASEHKNLTKYHKKGPLTFFSDYIRISRKWPSDRKAFQISEDTERMILDWEKDWSRVYTETIQDLWISNQTDFNQLGAHLLKLFSGTEIYPDLITELTDAAYFYLDDNRPEKALSIMNIGAELYPDAAAPFRGMAAAQLWLGNIEESNSLLKKAFTLDPGHSSLSIRSLERLGQSLKRENKKKEFLALADITAELYPENTDLLNKTGILFLNEDQTQKAIQFFEKALEIDPEREDIRKRLENLKKR